MNYYLAFSHEEVEDGHTFYYFRSGLFPASGWGDLLVLLTGIDELALLDLPAAIPGMLEEGEETQDLDKTTYEVPEDIYLIASLVNAFSPIGSTPLNYLTNAFVGQSLCVYSNIAPGLETTKYPEDFDPVDFPPNIETYPNWYIPDVAIKTLVVASRLNNTPFYTIGCFDYLTAYTGSYTCTGLPYNIHITCDLGQLDEYLEPSNLLDDVYWRYTGAARNIQSNAETWQGYALTYVDDSPWYYLEGGAYRPEEVADGIADPVIFFPEFEEEETPEPVSNVTPIVSPLLSTLLPMVNKKGLSTWLKAVNISMTIDERYGFAGDTVPFAGETKALVTTNTVGI